MDFDNYWICHQFDTGFILIGVLRRKYRNTEIAMAYRREPAYLVREHTKDKALVRKLSARSLGFYFIYLSIFLSLQQQPNVSFNQEHHGSNTAHIPKRKEKGFSIWPRWTLLLADGGRPDWPGWTSGPLSLHVSIHSEQVLEELLIINPKPSDLPS